MTKGTVRLFVRSALGTALAVGLLAWALPHITGASWRDVGTVVEQITILELAGLTLLWVAGLVAQSWVLTAALPGLSHSRALTLNLTGSAASNIAPMGGALGVATNLYMTRAWRVRDRTFAAFTLVSNVWDVMGKLLLPLCALVVLVWQGGVQLPSLRAACIAASVLIALTLVAVVAWLASEPAAEALGRWTGALAGRLPARLHREPTAVAEGLRQMRQDSIGIVRSRWQQLTLASVAYLVLQALLLWACLQLSGVPVALATLLVTFALERLGSLAVITPGGVGFGEAAALAALVALGSPAVESTAGLLLFRVFSFLIEIPIGGLWLGAWVVLHKRRAAA